jgi:uncharacterized repeat protein (TIGR03806 family)
MQKSRAVARGASLAVALAFGFGCQEESCPAPDEGVPDRLCQWGLFEGDLAQQQPAGDVIPYEVIANLFTDDALKHRFVRIPAGGKIGYSEGELWRFPVGSVLVKSFAYPADARDPDAPIHLIETRLLVHEDDRAWRPYVYRWNDAQTEAERFLPGTRLPVVWTDAEGRRHEQIYRIPSEEDCGTCHGGKEPMDVLGPRTRQLDRPFDHGAGPVNQIDHLTTLGLLDAEPSPADARQRLVDPFGDAPLVDRARSYLDANCAHCHREGGDAQSSGLWLNWENELPRRLGVCKIPAAAGRGAGGRRFDIVPGDPDASIMVFRMQSTEPDIMMPELGGLQNDPKGAALISEWIAAMEPEDCGSY